MAANEVLKKVPEGISVFCPYENHGPKGSFECFQPGCFWRLGLENAPEQCSF